MKNVIKEINKLIADLYVMFHKLQHYHWNIEGDKFQPLHDEFKKEYESILGLIDDFAERIRALESKPLSSLSDYEKLSKIKKLKDVSQEDMLKDIVASYDIIRAQLKILIDESDDLDDDVTEDMAIQALNNFDKKVWMFNSYTKKPSSKSVTKRKK